MQGARAEVSRRLPARMGQVLRGAAPAKQGDGEKVGVAKHGGSCGVFTRPAMPCTVLGCPCAAIARLTGHPGG